MRIRRHAYLNMDGKNQRKQLTKNVKQSREAASEQAFYAEMPQRVPSLVPVREIPPRLIGVSNEECIRLGKECPVSLSRIFQIRVSPDKRSAGCF